MDLVGTGAVYGDVLMQIYFQYPKGNMRTHTKFFLPWVMDKNKEVPAPQIIFLYNSMV